MPAVDPARPLVTVGISLKMYFGHARTMTWCGQVADLARRHEALTAGLARLFVLPSFPSIPGALQVFSGTDVDVGGQDLFWHDEGAFTGEVSGRTLRELGCTHAEVGHAERRRWFGEDDEVVARKTAAALRNDLVPVVCVGEVEAVAADVAADRCVAELDAVLAVARQGTLGPVTVAYEPQWAIGAPRPAPVQHIADVCAALTAYLVQDASLDGSRVIYGGSAGPGLLTALGSAFGGLFLGRLAHDPDSLAMVLDEVLDLHHHRD